MLLAIYGRHVPCRLYYIKIRVNIDLVGICFMLKKYVYNDNLGVWDSISISGRGRSKCSHTASWLCVAWLWSIGRSNFSIDISNCLPCTMNLCLTTYCTGTRIVIYVLIAKVWDIAISKISRIANVSAAPWFLFGITTTISATSNISVVTIASLVRIWWGILNWCKTKNLVHGMVSTKE